MKIEVFNRISIQEFKTNEKHIIISVCSPKLNHIILSSQESRLDTIFLKFHDIDSKALNKPRENCPICNGTGYIKKWEHIEGGRCFRCNREGLNLILFNKEDAIKILDFVKEYKDKIELIAVNCELGRSRSTGIAGALSKILNGDDTYFFKHYIPNMLVYRTIFNTYYENKI